MPHTHRTSRVGGRFAHELAVSTAGAGVLARDGEPIEPSVREIDIHGAAPAGRPGRGKPFELDSARVDLIEVMTAQPGHATSAARRAPDEAAGLQDAHGFPNR